MLATRFAYRSPVLRSDAPLTDDAIRSVAPSIFAEDKAASRSERYTYIPTIQVLRGLAREGFAPFMVTQARTRDESNREFTKHMIRLRHADTLGEAAGETANEIILVNSHNGSSSYQMLAGVFRFVCKNGLVVGEVQEDIRIPHRGDVVDQVIEGAHRVLGDFDAIDASREAMRETPLNEAHQHAFARAALALRFEPPAHTPAPVTEAQILAPRRDEDSGSDLWSVFNRVQENAISGGLVGRSPSGRRTQTRRIEGVDRSVALNRALWVLAEEMRALVA